MPHQISGERRECIQLCTACHNVCVETLDHELRLGGSHAAADHVRLLLDCAQLCATSDDVMLRCAEVCRQCAACCLHMAASV
jgi:hypothetical protein